MYKPSNMTIKLRNNIAEFFRAGEGDAMCRHYPEQVLQMVQAGQLTIIKQERIDMLYKLEPTMTARVFKFASMDPTPLEVLVNHKLYKDHQVQAAALAEPEFALNYYDHVLNPWKRYECKEALL